MPRSKNVDSWMYEQDPSIRQIAQFLRDLIFSIAPALRESVRWGNPSYEKHGNVVYISATDTDVTIGFFNLVIVDTDTSEKLRSLIAQSLCKEPGRFRCDPNNKCSPRSPQNGCDGTSLIHI